MVDDDGLARLKAVRDSALAARTHSARPTAAASAPVTPAKAPLPHVTSDVTGAAPAGALAEALEQNRRLRRQLDAARRAAEEASLACKTAQQQLATATAREAAAQAELLMLARACDEQGALAHHLQATRRTLELELHTAYAALREHEQLCAELAAANRRAERERAQADLGVRMLDDEREHRAAAEADRARLVVAVRHLEAELARARALQAADDGQYAAERVAAPTTPAWAQSAMGAPPRRSPMRDALCNLGGSAACRQLPDNPFD